jgi:flavin-dependent dehydrogenase
MSCCATLSAGDATEVVWDVIVIGAGPAGAVAARELARRGATTLLVERQSFPRTKVCGGSLNGQALASLPQLGLSHILPAAFAAPVSRFMVQANKRRVVLDLPAGVAIRRAEFDEQLVQSASDAGVAFLPETTAIVEPFSASDLTYRQVSLSHHGQQGLATKARIVIAADGLGHACLRHVQMFRSSTIRDARVGLGLVLHKQEAYEGGAIHMAIGRSGYVGLVRTADENLNVAAAVDPAALRATSMPGEFINRILRDAGLPLLSLDAASKWRGTLALSRVTSRLAGGRTFLLGDAIDGGTGSESRAVASAGNWPLGKTVRGSVSAKGCDGTNHTANSSAARANGHLSFS